MFESRYKGDTIEITLPREYGYTGYSVTCTYKYNKLKKKYSLSMWLEYKGVGNRYRMNPQEIATHYIPGTKDTIIDNICRIVERGCVNGFFKRYVKRYEYESKCFEYGNDYYENERLRKNNDNKE